MEGASDENAHPCCLQRLGNPGLGAANLRSIRAQKRIEGRFADVNGVRLHYLTAEKGELEAWLERPVRI